MLNRGLKSFIALFWVVRNILIRLHYFEHFSGGKWLLNLYADKFSKLSCIIVLSLTSDYKRDKISRNRTHFEFFEYHFFVVTLLTGGVTTCSSGFLVNFGRSIDSLELWMVSLESSFNNLKSITGVRYRGLICCKH